MSSYNNYNTSTNAGPHNSNMANTMDPRVDSDLSNSQYGASTTHGNTLGHSNAGYGTAGTTGATGYGNEYGSSTTSGPHNSNLMNKADPRVDSDNSRFASGGAGPGYTGASTHGTTGTTGTTGTNGTTGYGSSNTTSGPHNSNMMNKADPRVDSDNSRLHNAGYGANTNSGPHNSNMMNKADPRVDSDNSRLHNTGYGSSNTTSGPHNSNMMNKTDPRVDSDNSRLHNTTGYGSGTTGTTGYGQEHGPNTTSGPHNSNMMNKLDPRVDSDNSRSHHGSVPHANTGHTGPTAPGANFTGSHRDSTSTKTFEDAHFGTGPHTAGTTTGTTGTTGSHTGSTNAGPHNSNMMNKMDPRVDSDRDARADYAHNTTGTHGATTAHGSNNAGPHNSNMMNKADPRIDSDRDGRADYTHNTAGTHGATGTTGTTHTGSHGTHTGATSGTTGIGHHEKVHNSNLLNKLDPRVDSTTGQMKSSQNSSTPHAGSGHATGTSNTYGTGGGVGHTPATASNSTHTDYATGTSNSTRTGENVGSGVKGAAAEIHGMGEALRGGMGAAVDRAFGHEEGVAENDVIAQKGDREMRSGNFH